MYVTVSEDRQQASTAEVSCTTECIHGALLCEAEIRFFH